MNPTDGTGARDPADAQPGRTSPPRRGKWRPSDGDPAGRQREQAPQQPRRGQATRADIIAAGRRLFSEHGYHAAGIADLQQATGLTKGAFYHHFRSKLELALAILEQVEQDYHEHWFRPAADRPTPGERIGALLDKFLELNDRPQWCNCQMLVLLSAELTAGDDTLREAVRGLQRSFFESWRDLLRQAQEQGQADGRIDAETGAQWIMSTMAGLLLARKLGAVPVQAEAVVNLMKQALLRPQGGGARAGEPA